MPQGSPQFTPRQLLDAGHRAEAEGKLDQASQLYRHLADHYAYTAEAAEALAGLGRIGAGRQQLWVPNSAVPAHIRPTASGRLPGPRPSARGRAVARERQYRTGRALAALLSWTGWLIVVAGVALVPLAFVTDPVLLQRGLPYAASLGPAGPIIAAVALCLVGLAVVFWGQMARALFDQANATRELVAIARARRADHQD